MTVLWIDFLFATMVALAAGLGGWWLRCRLSGAEGSGSIDEKELAKAALSRLHELATRVAEDVGQHSSRVRELSDELSNSKGIDAPDVFAAVDRIVDANQQMQQQLASAQAKLQEQKRLIATHVVEARTDSLTELANRRALDDELARRHAELRRHGRPFSMIIFDVDHFKQFNDTHGHQAGDEVLRGVARVLRDTMREMDIVARQGGEEFAAILPGTTVEDAKPSVVRACRAIEQARFQYEGIELYVTVSAGVAQLQREEDIESLVRRADESLYASKQAGRNCGHWHDGQTSHLVQLIGRQTPPQPEELEPEPEVLGEPAGEEHHQPPLDPRLDPITGLSTRQTFTEDIYRRVAEFKRGGSTVSLVLLEIDDYLEMCARIGKAGGHTVMQATSQFLKAALREMDHAARYNGQSFGLLLPGSQLADAMQIAERLRRAIEQCELPTAAGLLRFTVSLGVTEVQQQDDPEQLLERTEAALKSAIDHGQNRTYTHNGEKCEPVSIEHLAASK